MKKLKGFVVLLAALVLAGCAPAMEESIAVEPGYDYGRFRDAGIVLNVYNWGEYISMGLEDDALDVNAAFEALTGIGVNYTNFDTNESLYARLQGGIDSYDVIIPSDYMIGRLAQEGLLQELDFSNIPNYSLIGDPYKGLAYDPDEKYSVPYTWGYVGIVYNTTMVEEEVTSWDILWDEKYAGDVLMFDNSRDAFAIASKLLGYSLNPENEQEIDAAAGKLKAQRSVVQAYVMDQIFDKMGGGEAALAPYYAGDAIIMMEENEDLAFAVPAEGTNYFVDAMCIPTGAENKEAAEMYINFMCETQVALANTLAIGYSTPQVEAEAALPEEFRDNPIAYPDEELLENTEIFVVLSDELNEYMDKAWSDVRSYDTNGSGWVVIVVLSALVVLAVGVFIWRAQVKKKRNDY